MCESACVRMCVCMRVLVCGLWLCSALRSYSHPEFVSSLLLSPESIFVSLTCTHTHANARKHPRTHRATRTLVVLGLERVVLLGELQQLVDSVPRHAELSAVRQSIIVLTATIEKRKGKTNACGKTQ